MYHAPPRPAKAASIAAAALPPEHMGVDPPGDVRRGVAESPADRHDVDPGVDQLRGVGVPRPTSVGITLWDVSDHYSRGDGLEDPWLGEDIQPSALSEREIDELAAFLAALTSPQHEAGDKEYARQLALSKISPHHGIWSGRLARSRRGRSRPRLQRRVYVVRPVERKRCQRKRWRAAGRRKRRSRLP